jgi:uncharacterized short protein YbdD (DUF466 family)
MKTIPGREPAAALIEATVVQRSGGALRVRLLVLVRAARQVYLQVFGIPDYEGYAAHMAVRHPGETLLSRREFFARSIDRKYCRSGPRCC